MGIMSYMFGKFIGQTTDEGIGADGFNITKFVIVTGSISLMLFGLGYALNGLSKIAEPLSDIIDELHDSNDSAEESTE